MGNGARAGFLVAVVAVVTSLLALASLHVLSPEFDPSWRMVSEYANGGYAWVLSLMFASWAASSWALAYALRDDLRTWAGRVGLGLLVLAGVGEAMAIVFDVNHRLHGLAFLFGVGGFLLASTLISARLAVAEGWRSERALLCSCAVLNWIAVLVMAIAMGFFIRSLRGAGVALDSGRPLAALPEGVTAVNGWANRFLIVVFEAWVLLVAWRGLKLRRKRKP